MIASKDPFLAREAQKYPNPIPSREYIMQVLATQDEPLGYEQLVARMELSGEEPLEALRRRIKAMQRDGQLMQNRRGAYALVKRMNLIAGRVQAHKDGFGFLLPDLEGDDLFLSAKQMRLVFNGDRVLVALTGTDNRGRKEGNIVEILERNTEFVVGHYHEADGVGFVTASAKQILHDIIIPPDKKQQAHDGQIVNVKILFQPTAHRQALGEVVEILGQYMAPGIEIDISIRAYGLPYEWSEEVMAACQQYSQASLQTIDSARHDLRELPLLTIDGEDAKDFDDAVYAQPTDAGWRLYVAIADVSYYVKPASVLDQAAQLRGNSVYFPGRVIPMLPEVLSNGLCSIKPNVDRLSLVCEMLIDTTGMVTDYSFYPAIMRSHARMTYHNVAKILQGDTKLRKQYATVVSHLEALNGLYKVLAESRQLRGALDFDSIETKIVFGQDKKIQQIVRTERNDAHRLIEEMMLAANVCTADFLLASELPVLYRVHGEPNAEKLQDLRKFLMEFSLTLEGGTQPEPADIAKLLRQIHSRSDRYLIQTVVLRTMSQAVYQPENTGHFGLAYAAYTHFTSPIRRYPDLLVHRAIYYVLARQPSDQWPYTPLTMQRLGEHCSQTERRADEATRDVNDWLKCEFMLNKVGTSFDGMITSVKNFGIFVSLHDIYVEGLVHITALRSDYYDYDPTHHTLTGQRGGMRYRLGDMVRVKVARVDLERRQIDFELELDAKAALSVGTKKTRTNTKSTQSRRRPAPVKTRSGK